MGLGRQSVSKKHVFFWKKNIKQHLTKLFETFEVRQLHLLRGRLQNHKPTECSNWQGVLLKTSTNSSTRWCQSSPQETSDLSRQVLTRYLIKTYEYMIIYAVKYRLLCKMCLFSYLLNMQLVYIERVSAEVYLRTTTYNCTLTSHVPPFLQTLSILIVKRWVHPTSPVSTTLWSRDFLGNDPWWSDRWWIMSLCHCWLWLMTVYDNLSTNVRHWHVSQFKGNGLHKAEKAWYRD